MTVIGAFGERERIAGRAGATADGALIPRVESGRDLRPGGAGASAGATALGSELQAVPFAVEWQYKRKEPCLPFVATAITGICDNSICI